MKNTKEIWQLNAIHGPRLDLGQVKKLKTLFFFFFARGDISEKNRWNLNKEYRLDISTLSMFLSWFWYVYCGYARILFLLQNAD